MNGWIILAGVAGLLIGIIVGFVIWWGFERIDKLEHIVAGVKMILELEFSESNRYEQIKWALDILNKANAKESEK